MINSIKLANVTPDKYFILQDGSAIKNIEELHAAVSSMSEDSFAAHVNSDKNDFYNWVNDVCQDLRLAKQLLQIKNREEMVNALFYRIREMKVEKTYENLKLIRNAKQIPRTSLNKEELIHALVEAYDHA